MQLLAQEFSLEPTTAMRELNERRLELVIAIVDLDRLERGAIVALSSHAREASKRHFLRARLG